MGRMRCSGATEAVMDGTRGAAARGCAGVYVGRRRRGPPATTTRKRSYDVGWEHEGREENGRNRGGGKPGKPGE